MHNLKRKKTQRFNIDNLDKLDKLEKKKRENEIRSRQEKINRVLANYVCKNSLYRGNPVHIKFLLF